MEKNIKIKDEIFKLEKVLQESDNPVAIKRAKRLIQEKEKQLSNLQNQEKEKQLSNLQNQEKEKQLSNLQNQEKEKRRKCGRCGSSRHNIRRCTSNDDTCYCYNCDRVLFADKFGNNKAKSNGRTDECKECLAALNKRYRDKNRPKCRKRWNKRIKKKRNEDPSFRLRETVGANVRHQMKNNGKVKNSSTWQAIQNHPDGYTPEELRIYLENQFDENMNWENYGKYWTIDHIVPQSRLVFDNFEDPNFMECWKLSNLRPLEKIENIKKSNKVI